MAGPDSKVDSGVPLEMSSPEERQRVGTLSVDKRPQNFSGDVYEMRKHIQRMRSRVWVPQKTRWINYLDMCVGVCVLFLSLVSPVDVCFTRAPKLGVQTMIGVACNAVLAVDCAIRFNRAYRDHRERGRWQLDRRKILKKYIRSWFLIDLMAAIPLDLPIALGAIDATKPGFAVRLVSLLRLVRCLKVVQVMPVIVEFLTTRLAMTHSSTELFKFAIILVLLVHYLAWSTTPAGGASNTGRASVPRPRDGLQCPARNAHGMDLRCRARSARSAHRPHSARSAHPSAVRATPVDSLWAFIGLNWEVCTRKDQATPASKHPRQRPHQSTRAQRPHQSTRANARIGPVAWPEVAYGGTVGARSHAIRCTLSVSRCVHSRRRTRLLLSRRAGSSHTAWKATRCIDSTRSRSTSPSSPSLAESRASPRRTFSSSSASP